MAKLIPFEFAEADKCSKYMYIVSNISASASISAKSQQQLRNLGNEILFCKIFCQLNFPSKRPRKSLRKQETKF